MNLTLWIIAGLLATAYFFSGAVKLIVPREKLAAAPGGGWVNDVSATNIRNIGVLEVLGAIGLIVPAAIDIAPVLVPVAAVGLALIMIGAVVTRVRREEVKPLMADLTYLVLLGIVIWGRFGPESFTN